MNSIKNKVIVVTGGKGLLGSEFVSYLRQQEAQVVALDRIGETDIDAYYVQADITSEESIQCAVALIVEKFGKIDGWVNNAYPRTADWGKQTFSEESMASFEQNVSMHLLGYIKCCQQVLNQMKVQGYGSLINVTSIYGIVGPDFSIYEGTSIINPSAYAAIKGGLINFTRYLSAYYGPAGVRVNCVSPGGIFDHQPAAFVKQYEAKVPLRRLGTPTDIAPSIAFLLSDGAKYVTGHNLVVDGGWTAI